MEFNRANSALRSGYGEAETKLLLISEANRLKGIIRKVWGKYEASYSPKRYYKGEGRTGQTRTSLDALSITPVFVVNPITNELGIRLNFPNDLYHDSIIRPSEPQGHSFKLISEGWHSKKLERKISPRHRFTYYEGADLINQIIEEYNSTKPSSHFVSIEFEWTGKGSFTR